MDIKINYGYARILQRFLVTAKRRHSPSMGRKIVSPRCHNTWNVSTPRLETTHHKEIKDSKYKVLLCTLLSTTDYFHYLIRQYQ